ncbi:MAG: PKD domain-containing protein [Verrucomicrobia bacterium]|nr:PKD domain-containing protein [Verrucomicrobiota bacterium]
MKKLSTAWLFLVFFLTVSVFARTDNRSRSTQESTDAENQYAAEEAEVDVQSFKKAARSDKHMRLDRDGRAHYVCQALPAQVGPDTTTYTSTALYPLTQTFLLHSRAGAAKVIYLDFKGHVTTGTSWNTTYAAGANITTPAFDTDGSPTTFSASEQAVIQEVWKRVSEDYAAWDVDVTTEDPGLESIRRTSTSDAKYGVRCVIGGSSSQWLGSAAGGVAYVGSFGQSVATTNTTNDVPAFIFPQELSNNAKYIAEAAAHEIGHTLGLYHSSQTNGNEYYAGHADWAPIMGVGYYKDVVQWTKGDYPLSNNTQDQIYLITLRVPRLTDEHGSTATTASVVSGQTLVAGGVISDRSDTDWFKITAGQGVVNVNGLAASPSANLKLSLSLVDEAGNVLATGTSSGMNSNLSVPVLGGNYYIVVDGVATGDALTAYTDYSSIGRYSLAGSWTPATVTNVPPVALTTGTTPTSGTTPLTVSFVGSNSYDPDGAIASYVWNFGDGTSSTLSNVTHTYSTAGTYNASLTVTDNSGAQSVGTVTIVVSAVPVSSTKTVNVSSMAISWVKSSSTTGYVSCTIKIVDQAGKSVSRASVALTATGFVSGSAIATTDSTGTVTINSSKLSSALTGSTTFAVTGVTLTGYKYDATKNSTSSVTLKR